LRASFGNSLDHRMALDALQLLQLGTEFLQASNGQRN
jgi:hypothetical protein